MIASSPSSPALRSGAVDAAHSSPHSLSAVRTHYDPRSARPTQYPVAASTSPLQHRANQQPRTNPTPDGFRVAKGLEEIQAALKRQTVDAGSQSSSPIPIPHSGQISAPEPAAESSLSTSSSAADVPPKGDLSRPPLAPPMTAASARSKRSNEHISTGEKTGSSITVSAPDPDVAQKNADGLISKRARPPQPTPKRLPVKYWEANPRDLVVLISSMLMELIRYNDKIPLRDGRLTRFHSRSPPRISVQDYLQRLTTHATLSPPILLSMVYYIDRLCAAYPAFTVSSLTVHRFLISSATVASKGLSDSFWTNKTYARVGGITLAELALLELEFLWRVEWRIVPQPEVLEDYYRSLVERCDEYEIEPEPEAERHSPSNTGNGGNGGSGNTDQTGS